MKNAIRQLLFCAALLFAGPGLAADKPRTEIDALTASPANFTLLLENEHVRVLEYVLLPAAHDQWHTHPPKVSYVLSGGKLEIHLDDGTSFVADEKAGVAEWAGVRGKHHVKNIGDTPVRILLVEDKSAARADEKEAAKSTSDGSRSGLIRSIERFLPMPTRAARLSSYMRYYAEIRDGEEHFVTGVFVRDKPGGAKFMSADALPVIHDGGCDVLYLKYDLRAKRTIFLNCGGDA